MDALHHYGSSSDEDEDGAHHSVEHEPENYAEKKVAAATARRRGKVRMVESLPLLVRSQPHVTGNWAGHCYCTVSSSGRRQRKRAEQSVRRLVHQLERAGYSGDCMLHHGKQQAPAAASEQEELHISLSRPFYLQAANLEPFVECLSTKLAQAAVPPFALSLPVLSDNDGVVPPCSLLHNDERTRSFAVQPVIAAPPSALREIVRHVDSCLALYRQPPYYDPPVFHVSLASFVPAVAPAHEEAAVRLAAAACGKNSGSRGTTDDESSSPLGRENVKNDGASSGEEEEDDGGPHFITEIYCKFGTTKVYTIPLQQQK